VANPRGRIGDPGMHRTLQMGMRGGGVTIPEVAEAFGVSKDSARRYVMRLVREGKLARTGERRRRPEVYERPRGAGGFIYRTPPDKEWIVDDGSAVLRPKRRRR